MPIDQDGDNPVTDRVSSGIAGLDEALNGGFPINRVHLVEGNPGTGKTTLALQFLLAGVRRGERVLYIALAETTEEIIQVARSHGWDLKGVTIREVVPGEESLRPDEQYTILHPAEVELSETIAVILNEVETVKPALVVLDSLAELRWLAHDPVRYRRQVLALKQFFARQDCTVLLLDNAGEERNVLASVAHSVVRLEQLAQEFGGARRRLRVQKLRGSTYRSGYHDLTIQKGGLVVFPRLVAAEHREPFARETVSTGVPELDNLLGGGLDRGSSVLLIGPAGAGKSTLATQCALAAATRGEQAALYIFDERVATFIARAEGLSMDIQGHVEAGRISAQQLDPAELSPGEFIQTVRGDVEAGARVVVIDSLNGYLNAMAEERAVIIQLHELLTYLGGRGVITFLTVAQHGLVGETLHSPIDASYLADAIIMLRYFEAGGQVRQAISVMKRRGGTHERSIREFRLGPGVQVGEPLAEFRGVLTGAPTYVGREADLLRDG